MSENDDQQAIDELSAVVERVAQRLTFPVELETEMGGTWVTQIILGRAGEDDPPDRATIDVGPGETWAMDIHGGQETVVSTLTSDADPGEVAQWIATEAEAAAGVAGLGFGSGAAGAPGASRSAVGGVRVTVEEQELPRER